MKTVLRVVAILLVAAVILPALASACPLCKEASSDADKPGATSMWRGMYWSILFMVSAPFAMVGTMIVLVRRARRRYPAPGSAPASRLRPLPESPGDGL